MIGIALGIFTVAALCGVKLAVDAARRRPPSGAARLVHVATVLVGSLLVIWSAFGDPRLWINVVCAVVIIGFGAALFIKRSRGESPMGLVAAHAGLAVVCYLILAYFVFVPAHPSLPG